MDGTALLRWGRACLTGLAERRAEINALNVFPVADADTGTNLLATMRAAVDAAVAVDVSDTHAVAAALARGAITGARGNSGILLSQVLRGMADAVRDGPLTGDALRIALARAAELVRAALSVPIEGTILTVLDCAAACAASCPDAALAEVAVAAADGAAKALGDTPSQLGVLRAAGVVDAGARGLVVMLDCLVEVVLGEVPVRPEYAASGNPAPIDDEFPSSAPHFEVMYLVGASDESQAAALRGRLAELGDSVVVVGDGSGTWSAHVHCADAGAAVEAGLAAGAVHRIRIESFAITAPVGHSIGSARAEHDRAVLAVADGAGAVELFETAGAVVLGADGPVTTDSLLTAIRRLPNREVLVLPNGALPAHELVAVGVAARDAHRDVLLLPSASMVQGLAALAVHDRGRIAVDDAFAMSEAAAGTRWGALRTATERALTMVGTCAAGDGLGLVGADVVVIDREVRAAGQTLLDRMLGLGGELVTLLMGADAPEGLADELTAHIGRGFPGVEVIVYSGGQHGDLVQIGVE
ncbi:MULTISPECIES: DAK2 domain-containing protein [unclassified Nocardia]|uniref:DAK2 domain-containing protein n=1 Tax=unclassified Nocardia TaxID=2637762 RepID=UPI001CE3D367|nr:MULTISPECIES: DAK2 domain-containing protein [unclassified Nocardia]